MDIQIQAIQFDADDKLLELVKEKIEKLRTFYDNIIDAEVYMRLENNNAHIKDKSVQIKINIPGSSLVAKEMTKKFEESLDLAIEGLTRQLKKHKEKIRN